MKAMGNNPLIRAWFWLMALSLATTALSLAVRHMPVPALAGAAILAIAYLKARLILASYLGLAATPFWRRGFDLAIGAYVILLLALYLVPEI
jgi:hypothetical protein